VHHLDPRVARGDVVGDGAGAVGGVVVDHQHVDLGGHGEELIEEGLEVVSLVVGGGDDEDAPERSTTAHRVSPEPRGGERAPQGPRATAGTLRRPVSVPSMVTPQKANTEAWAPSSHNETKG
jgi:hypothetical protein